MKKGFTYIELLITLAIIAVLFVPIMQLFSHSLYSSSVSQDLITATNLARWQMERIKNLGYTKEQLRRMGDIIYPPVGEGPMEMNNMQWRIKSNILKEGDPVEVRVSVYPVRTKVLEGSEIEAEEEALITLVTLVEDMYWEEVTPIR